MCKVPDALLKDVKKVHYLSTHPTLTTDRKKMFIAAHLDDRYEQGCINFETGAWESWGTTPFFANHDQINPVRDDIALLAWENCARTEDAIAYKKKNRLNTTAIIDFKTDTIVDLHVPTRIPFLDVKTDQLWYFRTVKDKGTT